MNTRRVVLAIFAVLIVVGFIIPRPNAQPESTLWLFLPGVDVDGNLSIQYGAYYETESLGSENRELIICRGEVLNESGKAYVLNPCSIDVGGEECCLIGSMVIPASGHAHFLGEFQCPCDDDAILCYQF